MSAVSLARSMRRAAPQAPEDVLGAGSDDAEGPGSSIHTVVAPAPAVRAARAVIEALVEAGVDTFFGIPGGPAAALFDALEDVVGARLVESRHETAALYAAASYHRASGKVPGVMVTAGPGATQAITGVISAHLERTPIILVSGDVAARGSGARLLQDSGPEGIAIDETLRRFVRATIRASRPESAASQAIAALTAATDAKRPGPALLVVPMDLASAEISPSRVLRGTEQWAAQPPSEAIESTCEWLAAAERPLLVIGAGCRGREREIRALVDAVDIPFVTTPQAKGLVSESHPRSLRNGGMAASQWARRWTAEGVDACLVLGTDLDDVSVGPTRYVGPGGRLVHVDLDASVMCRSLPTTLSVLADVGEFATQLRTRWAEQGLLSRCHEALRTLKKTSAYDVVGFERDASSTIAPHRAIADVQRALPDARFISDIGEHMLFALHYLSAKGPDAFHIHLALGGMGSGIAGAIGLSLADTTREVVCICGDGGMQMAGTEAMVAVRERLPITYVVFNDARYNMVHHGMKQLFGRTSAWETRMVDFVAWASAFGIPGARIEGPGEITADRIAALRARAGGGPVLLDVRIDRDVRIRGAGRVEALQQMSVATEVRA